MLQLKVKVKLGGYNDLPNVVLKLRLDEDNGLPNDVLVSRRRREDEMFLLLSPPITPSRFVLIFYLRRLRV